MTVQYSVPAEAPPTTWRRSPASESARAFRGSGPGWMRSLCTRCGECVDAIDPTTSPTIERAIWGDR